jgi:uncharacterized protein with PIN domain
VSRFWSVVPADGSVDVPEARLRFAAELDLFLSPRHRGRVVPVRPDGTSTLGHYVEALGVPLPEVGSLIADGDVVPPGHRLEGGERVEVRAPDRPVALPRQPAAFLLDVHLGTLARRLRLLGLDTAYRNDADDDDLVRQAAQESRLLLTQDRGLLKRRALWAGAYVRGSRPEQQLDDVLDRFAPTLTPWTRCPACNGMLRGVAKAAVLAVLEPGTRRTQQSFSRCSGCGRVYWPGAHNRRLVRIVERAQATVANSGGSAGAIG